MLREDFKINTNNAILIRRPIPRFPIKKISPVHKNYALEVLRDYCNNSSLHGIKYIGDPNKSAAEKLWWCLMFIISVAVCLYFISETYIKWQRSPVILSFEQKQTLIWEIPFPAITICPITKIIQSKFNYTNHFRNYKSLNKTESKFFWDVSLICHLDLWGEYMNIAQASNFTDHEVYDNFKSVVLQLEESMYHLLWQNEYIPPRNFFSEQITEEGLCFTFNSLSQEELFSDEIDQKVVYINHNKTNGGWNLENGFPSSMAINDYPIRTSENGFSSGISIYLRTLSYNVDLICGYPSYGYKIILHNPAETPRSNKQYILAPLGSEYTIVVKPEVTTTAETLSSIDPHVRDCYFLHEKSLKYFKMYTQNNCEIECLANITKHFCKCVPFYMPRDKKTKICGAGKLFCTQEVQNRILSYEMALKYNMKLDDDDKIGAKIFSECDCLASCSNIQFSAETSQADLHFFKSMEVAGLMDNDSNLKALLLMDVLKITQIDIFFRDKQFFAYHRSELYGQTDFFAAIGGLLGLFMGFSVLSLLEIVYFLTIRMWCTFRNKNKINKKITF